MSELDEIRHYYAEELRAVANLQSEALVRAFAKVPREHFLGPGPWQVFSPGLESVWTTTDAIRNTCTIICWSSLMRSGILTTDTPAFLLF